MPESLENSTKPRAYSFCPFLSIGDRVAIDDPTRPDHGTCGEITNYTSSGFTVDVTNGTAKYKRIYVGACNLKRLEPVLCHGGLCLPCPRYSVGDQAPPLQPGVHVFVDDTTRGDHGEHGVIMACACNGADSWCWVTMGPGKQLLIPAGSLHPYVLSHTGWIRAADPVPFYGGKYYRAEGVANTDFTSSDAVFEATLTEPRLYNLPVDPCNDIWDFAEQREHIDTGPHRGCSCKWCKIGREVAPVKYGRAPTSFAAPTFSKALADAYPRDHAKTLCGTRTDGAGIEHVGGAWLGCLAVQAEFDEPERSFTINKTLREQRDLARWRCDDYDLQREPDRGSCPRCGLQTCMHPRPEMPWRTDRRGRR